MPADPPLSHSPIFPLQETRSKTVTCQTKPETGQLRPCPVSSFKPTKGNVKSATLYYREGSSDKVYQVVLEPKDGLYVVNFAYGRRGTALNTGTKTNVPVNPSEASRIFEKLVKEKKAKGYTEGENGTPFQHAERENTGIHCQLLNPIDEVEVERLIKDDGWCCQEKKDGRRVLLQQAGAEITGINRKGLRIGLPSNLVDSAREIESDFILDGELVGEMLHVFDVLELEGDSIRHRPYATRLALLTELLDYSNHPDIQLIETAYETSEKRYFLESFKQKKCEGVVFKRLDAPYTAGRPNSGGTQLKHKFYATVSAVVAKLNAQRSVEVKLLGGDGWQTAGNVTIPPNLEPPSVGDVVEVRYLHAFPESGCLYQPVYLGRRGDVDQMDCLATQLKFKPEEDHAD